jgi:alanyl aminopeptidase
MSRHYFTLGFTLFACSSTSSTPVSSVAPKTTVAATATAPATRPAPTPPELRLPTNVRPKRNVVELTIDPAIEDFTGTITTEIDVATPTDVIWLNGDELVISTATATIGGVTQTATVTYPKKGYLALAFPEPVAAGAGALKIAYGGKMHRNDGDGIYTAQEAGDWYAFTQFEATDARQAFPTFDEPSFKVPWQLTLHTKQALVALANTPITSEHNDAGGMKTVAFAETKPLPSYLVAFAVGPFETLDAGKTASGAPIRVVFPHGRAADAAYPAKVTAELLERLEHYFGTKYPYPKLDLLAVSVFNAGAMENPGLITFRQGLLLTRPEELTQGRQEAYAITATHEMAHQWFGDYVTLAWWDDTWLNESFASWMETKIVAEWKPEWDLDVGAVAGKSSVMRQDSLDSARSIHQPIQEQGDIESSFDGITYGKGEAVLRMLERSIGPDTFQRGVRAYLAKHAWANATYEDFVGAMTEAAGKDLHPLFDSFVKQSGVPAVSFELACTKGAAPTLALAQRRYAPTGSKIDPKRTWTIPVCVRWGAGTTTGRECTVLDEPSGKLALSARSCPDWVLPNEGELGYYRPVTQGDLRDHLLAHARDLTLAERVGLVGDVKAMVASGELSNGVALSLVADLARDKSRHLVDASIGIVADIDDVVPDRLRPHYERFIRKLYQARARELGWHSKPGEGPDAKQLRPELLELVAGDGKDPELIAEATRLAWKWFDDHQAVEPELVGTVLHVAARYGDGKLFDRIHAEAGQAKDRVDRKRLLDAIGAFTDPKLVDRALGLVLTDEFDLRESAGVIQGALADPRTRMTTYAFQKQHFDEIEAKLPAPYRPYMAYFAVELCDDKMAPEIKTFLDAKLSKIDGGPHAIAQAMEQMSLCSAARKAQTPAVEAFLAKQ